MQKLFLISFSVLCIASVAYADSNGPIKAQSVWKNQSGSKLNITSIDSNGQLKGNYINKASGYQCQYISYPVTGWVYDTAITFTTIWKSSEESCNSITAWTGFYSKGKIQTLWQLVVNSSSDTIIKGSDTFTPFASKSNQSLISGKK